MEGHHRSAGVEQVESSRSERAAQPGPRPRLTLGDEAITVVHAPAGSGKTSLLRQWYRELQAQDRPVGWVDLDDPERRFTPVESLSDRCFEELGRIDKRTATLIVDHLDRALPTAIARLIERCEIAGVRLVIATRSAWVRRSSPGVRLVRADDLWLTDDEVVAVLSTYTDAVDTATIRALAHRLEGWASAAHIVGRVLQAEVDPLGFAIEFSGADVAIVDFYDAEVLGGLEETDVDLLVTLSIADRPEADLADELSGFAGSDERLSRLARSHSMLYRSDDGLLKWLPLAREVMYAQLQRRGEDQLAATRERALTWFRREHRYAEAIDQASAIGNGDQVVEIVNGAGLDFIARGEGDTVLTWLDTLPASAVEAHPGVAVIAATALWQEHGESASELIEDWLAFAEAAPAGMAPSDATSLDAAILAARSAFVRSDLVTRRELAREAFDCESPGRTSWAALAGSVAGLAAFHDDDPADARPWLNTTLLICSELESTSHGWTAGILANEALGALALIELDRGEFERATSLLAAGTLYQRSRGLEARPPGHAEIAMALCELDAHRVVKGENLLRRTRDQARTPAVRVLASLELGRSMCARHELTGAEAELRLCDEWMNGLDTPGSLIERRHAALCRRIDRERPSAGESDEGALTDREAEVLRLLDSDLTRREIGEQLFLAHNTVKTYVQRLFHKLGVSSRPAAIAAARERGWL